MGLLREASVAVMKDNRLIYSKGPMVMPIRKQKKNEYRSIFFRIASAL